MTRDRPYYLALLAEASAQVGQTPEGLEALTEALATVAKSGVLWWEAELYRLRGELLRQHPAAPLEEAEACFHQALDIARRRHAKSLELRAAMSLSRLWQQQGKRQEAATCYRRSMTGSPRALTPPTCKRPKSSSRCYEAARSDAWALDALTIKDAKYRHWREELGRWNSALRTWQ